MYRETESPTPSLERFREYLMFLVRSELGDREAGKIEPSDVVQETLLEAHRKLGQFRGHSEAEMAGWLRKMLVYGLNDARRALGRAKRDVAREQSLEAALDQSSARLGVCLALEQSSPSEHAQRHERAVRLADALARLPEAQRQAVVLRHYEGLSLEDISRHMGRSSDAVAGLLKRASKELRILLKDRE